MGMEIGRFPSVHPVVRIIFFLIFSLFLALGNLVQLAVAAHLLFVFYLMAGLGCLVNALPMLRRMRWFFLSIVVIYAWLTPGRALWGESALMHWWMPTVEGVLLGGHRLLALMMMVLAVQWLLWATTRAQLVSALYWLLTPLTMVGFSRERFVVRVMLILTALEGVQQHIGEQLKKNILRRGDLRGYATVAAALVSDVLLRGEQEHCQLIEVDIEAPPSLLQWLWPLALIGTMSLLA